MWSFTIHSKYIILESYRSSLSVGRYNAERANLRMKNRNRMDADLSVCGKSWPCFEMLHPDARSEDILLWMYVALKAWTRLDTPEPARHPFLKIFFTKTLTVMYTMSNGIYCHYQHLFKTSKQRQ